MTLHIVTVVYKDNSQLVTTYNSCNLRDRLNVRHWIFIKHYTDLLCAKYPRATVLPSEDRGIYNAMNLAFDHVRHHTADDDQIVFMNAGDCFVEDELVSHISAHVEKRPELSVAGTLLTRSGDTIGRRPAPCFPSDSGAVIYRDYPCHQATFYSARFLKETWAQRGFLYREELASCADLELYLYAQNRSILITPNTTAYYDIDGFSSNQSQAIAAEKLALLRKYNGGLRWHLYARIWSLRARLVNPKRRLMRAIGELFS